MRDREPKWNKTDRQTDRRDFLFLSAACAYCVRIHNTVQCAHYRPLDKRWKLAVFPSEWLFFSLWTKQQHQQQRGVHMWCVPVVAAAAAFSLCIINCRTPVVIDTCARHGSNRRGERWEATREEEKNDVRPVCIAVPLSCCDLWTWSCVRTSDIYLCCFVFIE